MEAGITYNARNGVIAVLLSLFDNRKLGYFLRRLISLSSLVCRSIYDESIFNYLEVLRNPPYVKRQRVTETPEVKTAMIPFACATAVEAGQADI